MSEKKQWKEREDLSISELEDIWFANRNLEMARSIILAVKDFQKIFLEEKLEFLSNIFHESSNLKEESNLEITKSQEKLEKYIYGPLLETFLFFLPEWKQELHDKEGWLYTYLILILLSNANNCLHAHISAGQIKKFVHSYLNSVKKEGMPKSLVLDILINNKMFEELINYNFLSDPTIVKLWKFVFHGLIFKEDNEDLSKRYHIDPIDRCEAFGQNIFDEDHRKNRVVARDEYLKLKDFLLFWDKVENRHALATLWTLLAKRGDLEKIFGAEKAEEVKKAE